MNIDRESMSLWVVEALRILGGKGEIVEICKVVWKKHGDEIRESGDLFYTWQYEIRWAGDILRKRGEIKPADLSPRGVWELA